MSKREWKARPVGQPEPGYFLMRLVRGGVLVAARIVHRDGLWHAVVDGQRYPPASDPAAAAQVFAIWHRGEAITAGEYTATLARKATLIAANPQHPAATPRRRIDLTKMPSLF